MIELLAGQENVQILHGIDAYTLPLLLRIEQKPKVVKQLINQDLVPQFHALTGQLVKDSIAKRVELGISIKNLLTYSEPVKEIERTNPATLKESRMLPETFKFNLIVAVFNDYVAVTKLDADNCIGYVIKDQVIADSFEAMFDVLWAQSKIV
jgi:hypothetical protein